VRTFLVGALNVQTQGAAAQLTKYKRFQRSFELSDVRLPKVRSRKRDIWLNFGF